VEARSEYVAAEVLVARERRKSREYDRTALRKRREERAEFDFCGNESQPIGDSPLRHNKQSQQGVNVT